jgi:hypothetical protein
VALSRVGARVVESGPGGEDLVPLENRIRTVDLGFVAASGGSDVLIDEAAQDRFSSDSLGIEVCHGDAGHVVQAAGDALGDALVRPGCVVVRLVFGQDGAQMPLAEDQEPVQELAAQGADEPFADRVHPRSLDGGVQDRGAAGLEDGVEGAGEVRAAIADQEPDVCEPVPLENRTPALTWVFSVFRRLARIR